MAFKSPILAVANLANNYPMNAVIYPALLSSIHTTIVVGFGSLF